MFPNICGLTTVGPGSIYKGFANNRRFPSNTIKARRGTHENSLQFCCDGLTSSASSVLAFLLFFRTRLGRSVAELLDPWPLYNDPYWIQAVTCCLRLLIELRLDPGEASRTRATPVEVSAVTSASAEGRLAKACNSQYNCQDCAPGASIRLGANEDLCQGTLQGNEVNVENPNPGHKVVTNYMTSPSRLAGLELGLSRLLEQTLVVLNENTINIL